MDRKIRPGGELEERRIERQNFLARGARAFWKDNDPLAGVEPTHDLFTGTRDVTAVCAVDKDRTHIAAYSPGEEPAFDFGLGDKNAVYDDPKSAHIRVAKMVSDKKKWRLGRLAADLYAHLRNADKAERPKVKDTLAPRDLVRDEWVYDQKQCV